MPTDLQGPQNSESEPSAFPKRDFRQEVTDQIIEMLEKGTAPWQTPWEPGALQLPHNPTTDRPYRGGNALHLMAVGARKGASAPMNPTGCCGPGGFSDAPWTSSMAMRSRPANGS